MSTPHKHAAILHAVADGKSVHWGFMSQDRWFSENFHLSMLQDEGYKFRVAPHRWQAEIDAIKAGVAVQGRCIGSVAWWPIEAHIDFDSPELEFRIKPEMLRYRVGLFRSVNGTVFTSITDTSFKAGDLDFEASKNFVRWLGDWQEVEA